MSEPTPEQPRPQIEHDAADVLDLAIIGAGAAGLMAGIFAGRTWLSANVTPRIAAFDSARKLGAKILVAGGGRCNVTHHAVDEKQYAGSSPPAIRNVLRRFDVADTVEFFELLGVELKQEETGKLFPVTDSAHSILNALLRAAHDACVDMIHPARVLNLAKIDTDAGPVFQFNAGDDPQPIRARRVILSTGGKALPKSGSDGSGYDLARGLGHTTTARIFPALVPLVLAEGHWMRELSGVAVPATMELRANTGKRLKEFTNSVLFTHFGLSGPGVLDISRYWTDATLDGSVSLVMNFAPGVKPDELDRMIVSAKGVSIARWLCENTPIRVAVPGHGHQGMADRVARAICHAAGVDPAAGTHVLTRDQRRAIVQHVTECPIPATGDRGFTAAEVTAGGVPLREVHLATMESRICPGLFLCGEILDVDGRIGGFNFQWAWASGFVAGRSAAISP
jgi:predicted Rossmann fold flavoprotein